ncbi:MAG TPA: glycosyltransferase [Gemmataceae bacterium]|nr:glycosyltransferase [Gemmataceae bacterium]
MQMIQHGPHKQRQASTGATTVVVFTTLPWNSACPVLRLRGPARYAGISVLPGNVGEVAYLDRIPGAGLVIIQRDFPRHKHIFQGVMATARRHQVPIIYESDDLLLDLPEDHPDKAYYRDAWFPIMRALLEADAVTTSTETLAGYYRLFNPNTRALPNCIDPELWPVYRAPTVGNCPSVVIGYMGTHTHVTDLRDVASPLVTVLEENAGRVQLKVWGPPLPPLLANRPDVLWEPLNLVDYRQFAEFASRQRCDIFIAPLRDNEFNRCKSHLKFLEYSALGIPGVYSRVIPYEDVVVDGQNALFASTSDEWRAALRRLINDPLLRVQIGNRAQQSVREHWLLTEQAARWREFYDDVPAQRRQTSKKPLSQGPLRHLGMQLQKFEQELEQKELVVQLLTRSLAQMQDC